MDYDDNDCLLIDVHVCEGNWHAFSTKHLLENDNNSLVAAIKSVPKEYAEASTPEDFIEMDDDDDPMKVKVQRSASFFNTLPCP
jgi:hypothetical protein